jgi:hypothetical protein
VIAGGKGLGNRLDDPVVGAASTEVATHPLTNFRLIESDARRRQILCNGTRHAPLNLACHADGGTELTGSAIAALKPVMIDECLLQRIEMSVLSQPLDSDDLAALILHRQGKAGVNALAFNKHGACAAGALVASLFRACTSEAVSEQIEERRPDVCLDIDLFSVDNEMHRLISLVPDSVDPRWYKLGGTLPVSNAISQSSFNFSRSLKKILGKAIPSSREENRPQQPCFD